MAQPEPDSELQPGLLLGGKYRLEREIGRGAMGTVWSALHESLHQRVAIKVISQEHAHSEELRKRFDTEARAAAKLRSRFVVGVTDNGETGKGLPYIVMEYLEGECLEDRIARLGSISLAETARIARHVSRALGRAHAHGIVHRDLKPANIFISRSDDDADKDDWTAKVLDFGIAKMDDFGDRSTTKTGTVLGTPLFMSPEQVRGASSVDARADLYSFGMVVYNMVTGTYAFEGQSFGDLLVSICTDPLPELCRSAPNAPAELDEWFQKACARDPDKRYQTAEDMMRGLAHAIDDQVQSAARMSMSDVSMRYSQPMSGSFAAEDTATSGTPRMSTIAATVASPRTGLDSSGVAASAVTVNQPPPRAPRTLRFAAIAAVGLVGVVSAFVFSGETKDQTAQSPGSSKSDGHEIELNSPPKSATGTAAPQAVGAPRAPDSPQVGFSQEKLNDGHDSQATTTSEKAQSPEKAPSTSVKTPPTGAAIKTAHTTPKTIPATQTTTPVVQTNPEPPKPATQEPAPVKQPRPQVPDLGF